MAYLSIFDTEIRIQENLYSLNDLHIASGNLRKHEPNRFMRLDNTQKLIEEISRTPDLGISHKASQNGKYRGTWVSKELVYAYAMWISPRFNLQVIRAFDHMHRNVTESSPQLPVQQNSLELPDFRHQRVLLTIEHGEIVGKRILDRDELIMNRYQYINYFKEPDIGFSDLEQLAELSRLVSERLCKQVSKGH